MIDTANLLALFGTIFLLNMMPVFVPSTWIVVLQVGFLRPEADPVILAGVATYTVTADRLVPVRLSCLLVRNHWMREADHQSTDVVCVWLEGREGMMIDLMFAYVFDPFPSSYIFTAYGSAGIRLWSIDLLFFVSRWVSYLTWAYIAQTGARYLNEETEIDGAYMGMYLVMSQVVFLVLVYGSIKLDWQHLL